jgi:alpha-amylase
LVDAHHRYAGGESSILHVDPDLYIMQRDGTEAQNGLIYVLNNLGSQWSGPQ